MEQWQLGTTGPQVPRHKRVALLIARCVELLREAEKAEKAARGLHEAENRARYAIPQHYSHHMQDG